MIAHLYHGLMVSMLLLSAVSAEWHQYEQAFACQACVSKMNSTYNWTTKVCSAMSMSMSDPETSSHSRGQNNICHSNNSKCCAIMGCRSGEDAQCTEGCCLESDSPVEAGKIEYGASYLHDETCEKATTSQEYGDGSTCEMILSFPSNETRDDVTILVTEVWFEHQDGHKCDCDYNSRSTGSNDTLRKLRRYIREDCNCRPAFNITANETYAYTSVNEINNDSSYYYSGYYFNYQAETYSYYIHDRERCLSQFQHYKRQLLHVTNQNNAEVGQSYDGPPRPPVMFTLSSGDGCTDFGKLLVFKYAQLRFDLLQLSKELSFGSDTIEGDSGSGTYQILPGPCNERCSPCALCTANDERELKALLHTQANSMKEVDEEKIIELERRCSHIRER
jgi:hypothetical protein